MQVIDHLPVDKAAPDLWAEASEDAARLLRAMSHAPRLRLLCMLLDAPCSSGDLARRLGLREAAASQQLARLRLEGLVFAQREGKRVIYSITNPVIARLVAVLQQGFCKTMIR